MANKTQVCNLKIWIKEIFSLSKARGVITENILLLKYQKQAITSALNGKDAFMLLPTALRKSCIYQVLAFIVSQVTTPIWNKAPGREFYWSADHEFYTRLVIWNCKSVWSTDKFVWKLMLLRKNESSLDEKTISLKDFFFKWVEIQ